MSSLCFDTSPRAHRCVLDEPRDNVRKLYEETLPVHLSVLETDSSNHIALQKVLLCLGLSYFKSPRVPLPLTIGFQNTALFLCLFLSILLFDHHCHSHHGDHIERVPLIAHLLMLHFDSI